MSSISPSSTYSAITQLLIGGASKSDAAALQIVETLLPSAAQGLPAPSDSVELSPQAKATLQHAQQSAAFVQQLQALVQSGETAGSGG